MYVSYPVHIECWLWEVTQYGGILLEISHQKSNEVEDHSTYLLVLHMYTDRNEENAAILRHSYICT